LPCRRRHTRFSRDWSSDVCSPELRIEDDEARGTHRAVLAARGEHSPVRSACLVVVDAERFPLVDLRIDDMEEPIAALRRLWEKYIPFVDEYVVRAVDPDRAPGTT